MPAKKAKKEAAPTAAKKTAAVAPPQSAFNLLDSTVDWAAEAGLGLQKAVGRRKGREITMCSQSQVRNAYLPLESLALQWALGNAGMPPCVVNLMGKAGVGKTTLLYSLFGRFMTHNMPCAVLVGDGKMLHDDWAVRALWPDAEIAARMSQKLLVDDIAQLDQMWETLSKLCALFRDPKRPMYVPKHIPVVVAVDIINKMATRAQAAGIMQYAGLIKEDEVEHGDRGHKMDRSGWYHDMVASLRALQYEYNVLPYFVEHQNQAGVMGGGKPAGKGGFTSPFAVDSTNKVRPGGEALNQISGVQMTVVPKGVFYAGGQKIGTRVYLTVVKNSYGPGGRACCFGLKTDGFDDRPGWNEPCVRWDWGEIEWLAEQQLLGMRVSSDQYDDPRYSCDALGIVQATITEAADAWTARRADLMEELGTKLKIAGYRKVAERVLQDIPEAEAVPKAAAGRKASKKAAQGDVPPPPPSQTDDAPDEGGSCEQTNE